jgi:hypothetical protein
LKRRADNNYTPKVVQTDRIYGEDLEQDNSHSKNVAKSAREIYQNFDQNRAENGDWQMGNYPKLIQSKVDVPSPMRSSQISNGARKMSQMENFKNRENGRISEVYRTSSPKYSQKHAQK